MAKSKLCSRLQKWAEKHLFLDVDGTKVWHVLKDRNRLMYWYCIDPIGIPDESEGAHQFDIRELPEMFTAELRLRRLPFGGYEMSADRGAHAKAITQAINAGFDLVEASRAQERARDAVLRAETKARLAAKDTAMIAYMCS